MKAEGRGSRQGSENTLAFTQDLFLLSGFCFLLNSLVLTCTADETIPNLLPSTGPDRTVSVNRQMGETLLLPPLYNAAPGKAVPDIKKIWILLSSGSFLRVKHRKNERKSQHDKFWYNLFLEQTNKNLFGLKFLDASVQRKPALMLSVTGMCSISRKVDVCDEQVIWPALSSADTSHWEWLHTFLKEVQNTILLWWEIMSLLDAEEKEKIAICSDFRNSTCHFLTCSFPWNLVSISAAGWEHWRKDGKPYRNSEVAVLCFNHAFITNRFSCSKNVCSFPVVSITMTWMMYAASGFRNRGSVKLLSSSAALSPACMWILQWN